MGITGLTSYMEKKYSDTEVFEWIELHSCSLIIDGYSLLHRTHASHCHSTHGGNYDALRNVLATMLENLLACEIRPVVLFDGACDELDRKFVTSVKRAGDRLKEMALLNSAATTMIVKTALGAKTKRPNTVNLEKLVDSGEQRLFCNMLPLSAYDLFIDLLEFYSIPHYQCFFEADYHLAYLANQLECPVLSMDSDFLIYDLKHGYISINNFDTDIIESEEEETGGKRRRYMRARIYKLDRFLAYFNSNLDYYTSDVRLRKEMLAVFAVLCGNDYVTDAQTVFASFFAGFDAANNNINFRQMRRCATAKRKDAQFERVLEWLAQFASARECVEILTRSCKKDMCDKVRELVDASIKDYMLLRDDNLADQLDFICKRRKANPQDITPKLISEKKLSQEFLCKYVNCNYPRSFMDVVVHQRVIFNSKIEVSDWPSVYISAQPIRQLIYSLLISGDKSSIQEYLRYEKEIKIFEIQTIPLPKQITNQFVLVDVLKFSDRIVDNLDIKYKGVKQEVKYLFCLVKYWLDLKYDKAELNDVKSENYKRAFIVGLIKLSLIDRLSLRKSEKQQQTGSLLKKSEEDKPIDFIPKYLSSDGNLFDFKADFDPQVEENQENNSYIRELKTQLNRYSPSSNYYQSLKNSNSPSEKYLNLRIVHFLCEFQALYSAFTSLQKLIDDEKFFPFLPLNYFFNATFLHNFILELDRRVNPDLFIADFFGRKSIFRHIYLQLIELFDGLFLTP